MSHPVAEGPSTNADTLDLARRVARETYGIEGGIKRLPGFDDDNFLIDAGDARWVLKLVPPDADPDYVHFQAAILDHLSQRRSQRRSQQHVDGQQSFRLPQIVHAGDGAAIVSVSDDEGRDRFARLVTYIEGAPMSKARPHASVMLRSVGSSLATVDQLLADFSHPGAERFERWDLARAPDHAEGIEGIENAEIRRIAGRHIARFSFLINETLAALPSGVIHNDANDNNIIVAPATSAPRTVTGIIDFGDAVQTARIFEVAIAATYALLGKRDPLSTACEVVSGYAAVQALQEDELHILFPSILARLSVSAIMAAKSRRDRPDNAYLQVSDEHVHAMLRELEGVDPDFAEVRFRAAAGLEPCPLQGRVRSALDKIRGAAFPVLGRKLDPDTLFVHDISVAGSVYMPDDLTPDQWSRQLEFERAPAPVDDHVAGAPNSKVGNNAGSRTTGLVSDGSTRPSEVPVGLGRYAEYRLAYTSDQFRVDSNDGQERRTLHLGVDLFDRAGTPVHAPIGGHVYSVADNGQDLDYGPTIILRHDIEGIEFFTLFGHLAPDVLERWKPGDEISAGTQLGSLGDEKQNGGWPPHLHLQAMTRLFGEAGNFPGVAPPSQATTWLSLSPNPAALLGLPDELVQAPRPADKAIRQARALHLGRSLSLAYEDSADGPLHIVRGRGATLYAADGRAYLDCVNNVCHVGHSHPRVVAALSRQAAILNTNTRYLHENLASYVGELAATLPEPLSVVFLVCSGSEANDLAIRLARAATGRTGIAVVDHAYHGNLSSLIDISPYKFNGHGGGGRPDHVAVVPMPDVFRGVHGAEVERYVEDARRGISEHAVGLHGLAAFFAESLLSCGGQVELPPGYLAAVYEVVRLYGGVCVADEVQVGFGRVGTRFWGFETQEVVPDIVTMGKPIGNGHPLAAVVTTPSIAAEFANGMEYFNTFGGNPVSCAVGREVLSIIRDEGLQERARDVGEYLKNGLLELKRSCPIIGDVRGMGLFLGIELIDDIDILRPGARQAKALVHRMRDRGVLLSTDGPDHNVIKIKPPLVFGRAEAGVLLDNLAEVLAEDALRSAAR